MLRPVRLPDSQEKGQCPPYAPKGLGVVCCFGSDKRKRKERVCHFREEVQTSEDIPTAVADYSLNTACGLFPTFSIPKAHSLGAVIFFIS